MPDVRKALGIRIKELRLAAGRTQAQLAEALEVQTETISRLERGHSLPSVETMLRIAKALDTDLSRLFDLPLSANRKRRRLYLDQLQQLFEGRREEHMQMAVDVIARIFDEL